MSDDTTNLHLEVFDPNRQQIWKQLKMFRSLGVLGGGSALALQLGHRYSYDFDIFIDSPVKPTLLKQVTDILNPLAVRPILNQSSQLEVILNEAIHLTFFYFPFPCLHSLVKTASLSLFDLKDLASNKAYTIGFRGTWRDYVDLYWLIAKSGQPLSSILHETEQRFRGNFSRKLFFEQLVYWGDIEEFAVDYLSQEIPKETVQEFFKTLVKQETQLRT